MVEPISEKTKISSKSFELSPKQVAILEYCKEAKSREVIFVLLGMSNQTTNYKNKILPLIDFGYLNYTKPEKKKVRGQQYIITSLGSAYLDFHLID